MVFTTVAFQTVHEQSSYTIEMERLRRKLKTLKEGAAISQSYFVPGETRGCFRGLSAMKGPPFLRVFRHSPHLYRANACLVLMSSPSPPGTQLTSSCLLCFGGQGHPLYHQKLTEELRVTLCFGGLSLRTGRLSLCLAGLGLFL